MVSRRCLLLRGQSARKKAGRRNRDGRRTSELYASVRHDLARPVVLSVLPGHSRRILRRAVLMYTRLLPYQAARALASFPTCIRIATMLTSFPGRSSYFQAHQGRR